MFISIFCYVESKVLTLHNLESCTPTITNHNIILNETRVNQMSMEGNARTFSQQVPESRILLLFCNDYQNIVTPWNTCWFCNMKKFRRGEKCIFVIPAHMSGIWIFFCSHANLQNFCQTPKTFSNSMWIH